MSASRFLAALVLFFVLTVGFAALPAAYARFGSATPRTWRVLVGGQSDDMSIQADAYYPHVITIDVGDKVVWALNAAEPHSVTFFGTCQDLSCFQPSLIPCLTSGALDFVPCSLPSYDGIGLASSGRMIQPGFNWDNAVAHGNTTYSLIFTNAGVNIYFDVSALGMRGIVIVNPAGTPYPFTQEQYSAQGRRELSSDLAAGVRTLESFQTPAATPGPQGTLVHYVAAGLNTPQATETFLHSSQGSHVHGTASLDAITTGLTETLKISVKLSGLAPGHLYSSNILLGVCGSLAPTVGLFGVLPTFSLNSITGGTDGRGSSTTLVSLPPNPNGPNQLRIPSVGWFISITDNMNNGSEKACGNIRFHNTSVVRFLPRNLHINVWDTVVWNSAPSGVHFVTFLAGQAIPLIPDFVFAPPTGNATSYDGLSFFNSGRLILGQTFVLTFTRPGEYSYVDVLFSSLRMQGTIIVQSDTTGK